MLDNVSPKVIWPQHWKSECNVSTMHKPQEKLLAFCFITVKRCPFSQLQVVPKGSNLDRIATPSPEPSPRPWSRKESTGSRPPGVTTRPCSAGSALGGAPRRSHPWADSLSTISEEPPSYHSCSSHEIVVHPEVVVETTTVTTNTTTVGGVDTGHRVSDRAMLSIGYTKFIRQSSSKPQ